jgi:GntR family transcriptional regulator, trigonelline degradation regulator
MNSAAALKVERNIPTLRELTLEKMREAILSLQFQPGDRLIERQLCEHLGVSRTIVREVLRHLESEGLVQTLPHKGPIVAKPTVAEMQQIYELRALLEGLAARTCAELKDQQTIAALEKALKDIRKAYASRDANQHVLQATTVFYHTLFHAAGKTVAWGIESSLNARMNHLRAITINTPNRNRSGPAAMEAIVNAIRQGKPDAAYKACVDHVAEASRLAQEYLASSSLPAPAASKPAKRGSVKARSAINP